MSWVGWLILAALFFYLPVVLARGAVEVWYWFLDNFTDADVPRREESRVSRREQRRRTRRAGQPVIRESGQHTGHGSAVPVKVRRFDPLAPLTHLVRNLMGAKRFDYWVARALEERDPDKKVKYCTKAVTLNPTYVPGWGLKGTTLLEMQRYAEAQECFDKVLQLAPSALAWYRKGLCCHHLHQHEEAIRCFNKTLDTCASSDRALADDAARYKSLSQAAAISSRGAGNPLV